MSEDGGYNLKRCAKCAAMIPTSATMCAYCGTSSPDKPLERGRGPVLSMRHGIAVTDVLIVVNLAYFLFSILVAHAKGLEGNPLQWCITGTGFTWGVWLSGGNLKPSVDGGEWWRLFSANFLHFGLWHIALNMFALRDLGRLAERLFGPAKFLAIYLTSGVGCTVAMHLWAGISAGPGRFGLGAGASGAICGLMGVLIVFLVRAGTARSREFAVSLGRSGLVVLGIGFFLPAGSTVGHVGGAVIGAAFGLMLRDAFVSRIAPTVRERWRNIALLLVSVTTVALFLACKHALTFQGDLR